MTIRVVVVDDESATRATLSMALSTQEDMEVVGEAADGKEAIGLVSRVGPDVIVMDVNMPVMDGVKATKSIRKGGNNVPIVFFTSEESIGSKLRDIKRTSLVLKGAGVGEVLTSIRAAAGAA